MAKSQQTFNKKEIEKKKLKKKKDKEEKKEERRANNKDQTFEEMLAYVDENGNISSTPPDPKKMRIIKSEDIQLGIMKQADVEPADLIRKGTVTFFNDSKGYGFIKDTVSQESFFVHMKGLIDPIKENNKVTFEVEMTPKGPSAIAVKLAVD
jgi:cold shock CspA family protein